MRTNEVSGIYRLPFYPIAYGLGLACLVQCLALVVGYTGIAGGGMNEIMVGLMGIGLPARVVSHRHRACVRDDADRLSRVRLPYIV